MNQTRVTFGFINCNRLFYLRSCIESLLECTKDYANKELIIIDNASVEPGTKEYLDEKESQGFIVVRQDKRDPSNEFAKGLNTIAELATGDLICPLQADVQFVLEGDWLSEVVALFQQYAPHVGCVILDAQRNITNQSHKFSQTISDNDFRFVVDTGRNPISGAGDVMYSREVLDLIYPWHVKNKDHEGGQDSETEMLNKIKRIIADNKSGYHCFMPVYPVSAAIHTDKRGTNARIRGNKRYGDYWAPKEDNFRYYDLVSLSDIKKENKEFMIPLGIEDVVNTVGFDKPVDKDGVWLKNPIRPETAKDSDFVTVE
jgi:glycosyltransferase involved in cell wall biosynthesis